MEVKQGYKKTELGVIPEDWNIVQLGDIGNTLIGLTYTPKDVSDFGTLVLRSSNIQNNQLAYENNVYVDMELPSRVMVQNGDLLICVRNGSKQLIGKCTLIDKNAEGSAFGAFMSIYRSEFSRYVVYVFQSSVIQSQIDQIMGATINQITNKNLSEFKVPLPPLPEQKAIAEVLSDTDTLIQSLEKLIAKKRLIKQGAMQELLTPKEGWVVRKLGEYVTIRSGESPSKFYFKSWGVPYFKVDDLNNSKKYQFDTSYYINYSHPVESGSIIFPKRGASILLNKIRIAGRDCFFDTNLMSLTSSEGLDNEFLYYILCYMKLWKIADTTSIPQLNNKHINPFEFSLPALSKQRDIAKILSNMDSEIKALEKKLAKYKEIKQGLMQKLLTGEIRLIEN